MQRRNEDTPILVRYGPPRAADTMSSLTASGGPAEAALAVTSRPLTAPAAAVGSADQSRASWKGVVRQAIGMWVATRLLLVAFTLATALLEVLRGNSAAFTSPLSVLDLWRRFDVNAYLHIAAQGYDSLYYAGFFPLYPLLISGAEHLLGTGQGLVLAMLISNLGTLVAFAGLARLVIDEGGGERASLNTLLALAAYPMAFFLGAAYTEGPFIAVAVWGLWSMRRGHWYVAAGCALLAALLRPTGLILCAPLLYEFARHHDWGRQVRSAVPQALAVLVAGPAGVGIYSVYCALHYGDALAWLHSEATYWGRPSMPIWQSLHDTTAYIVSLRPLSADQDKKLVDYVAILIVLVLTLALARRRPVAFTLYLAGLLYLTISTPQVISAPAHYAVFLSASRIMLPALPIYLEIGCWSVHARWQAPLLLCGGVLLQAIFAVYFLQGGWVA